MCRRSLVGKILFYIYFFIPILAGFLGGLYPFPQHKAAKQSSLMLWAVVYFNRGVDFLKPGRTRIVVAANDDVVAELYFK